MNEQLIADIYNLRDLACYNATKYRFDPTFSRMHEEYLNEIKAIIAKIQKEI